jgi:hypothetical protein
VPCWCYANGLVVHPAFASPEPADMRQGSTRMAGALFAPVYAACIPRPVSSAYVSRMTGIIINFVVVPSIVLP